MRLALVLSALAILRGQGAPPKTKAADYPVQAQMDTVTLAAEYLVHSLPTAKGTLVANDYLVVEVAFFGPPFSRLKMSPDNFQLKINGRGQTLATDPAAMVASSIKFPTGPSVGIGDDHGIQHAALLEGEQSLPRSGLLYFLYRGKTKGIHSVDLFYEGPMGKATLKLK